MGKTTKKNFKKADKLEDADLSRLQQAVNYTNQLQFELGKITASQHTIAHRFSQAQDQIKNLQVEIETKYGTTDIDLQTGDIKRGDE